MQGCILQAAKVKTKSIVSSLKWTSVWGGPSSNTKTYLSFSLRLFLTATFWFYHILDQTSFILQGQLQLTVLGKTQSQWFSFSQEWVWGGIAFPMMKKNHPNLSNYSECHALPQRLSIWQKDHCEWHAFCGPCENLPKLGQVESL